MKRAWRVSSHESQPLVEGWQLREGTREEPLPALVPGTVAGALRAAGAFSWDVGRDLETSDWHFEVPLPARAHDVHDAECVVRCEGVATHHEVIVDGEVRAVGRSMFVPLEAPLRSGDRLLSIRCAALRPVLAARAPRPRWRTRLVADQSLRSVRTSLLGRMSGWSPPAPAIGPYRPVELITRRDVVVDDVKIQATLLDGNRAGMVEVTARLRPISGAVVEEARLELLSTAGSACVVGGHASLSWDGGTLSLRAQLLAESISPWWPHTHGAQPLYPLRLELIVGGGRRLMVELGAVGFRRVELDERDDGFALRINDVPIFCRGANWTPPDVVTLNAPPEPRLARVRAAGMNMLRLAGTMLYEDAAFHRACDRQGILVWQDVMLANMDYPSDDETFRGELTAEVEALMARLAHSPSLVVVCGGSEVEQQAAMLGLPREAWRSPLQAELIPSIVAEHRPDVVFWPNSPGNRDLDDQPFVVDRGVSHYYGVSAYLRPVEDARRANVRFATECLAFGHVPDERVVDQLLGDGEVAPIHPRWKARVPRDRGVGWDFDDVRDHYLARVFGVDPTQLRSTDPARYLELGRVVTGEVMAAAFAEWRRVGSTTAGALVWTLGDFWPGAGLGVLDAHGGPKAAYWFLRRCLQPVTLLGTDEGNSGLVLHVVNERPEPLLAIVEVVLLRDGAVPVAQGQRRVTVPGRQTSAVRADALLDGFRDVTYAFRFGPPSHDVVWAGLLDPDTGATIADWVYFPTGRQTRREDVGLEARVEATQDSRGDPADDWAITLTATRLAESVSIDLSPPPRGSTQGLDVPELQDNYVHVVPGRPRVIRGRGRGRVSGRAMALNGRTAARFELVGK